MSETSQVFVFVMQMWQLILLVDPNNSVHDGLRDIAELQSDEDGVGGYKRGPSVWKRNNEVGALQRCTVLT